MRIGFNCNYMRHGQIRIERKKSGIPNGSLVPKSSTQARAVYAQDFGRVTNAATNVNEFTLCEFLMQVLLKFIHSCVERINIRVYNIFVRYPSKCLKIKIKNRKISAEVYLLNYEQFN